MLSLPLIIPRDEGTLWPTPSTHAFSQSTAHHDAPRPSSRDAADHPHAHAPSRRFGGASAGHASSRNSLAALVADENVIEQRKQNVRRFGAGWIRPPGVAKTYQATMDELVEREEQEMLARREQAMMELAGAAEMEAQAQLQRQQQQEGEEGETGEVEVDSDGNPIAGEEEEEGEHDLDDDVPEAEDVTFNEDSLLEGSVDDPDEVQQMLELEEAEMTGALQEERDLDRDLDDEVPEAGSYQHTDTELEDSSDDSDDAAGNARVQINEVLSRHSFLSDTGSSVPGSSFLEGSPVAGRGRGLRDRMMQGRPNGRGQNS